MRLLPLAIAVAINALLLLARPWPDMVWLHPVAPPLTHVPGAGEKMLGPDVPAPRDALFQGVRRAVEAVGTPEQKAAVARLVPPDVRPRAERAMRLRVAVEDDVAALADALGPERVGAMIAAREDLADRYGEGRVWREAAGKVAR